MPITTIGYCGLGRAVSALGLATPDPIEMDYIAPSLGSVGAELVTALYYAAQGDDGLREYRERTARGKGSAKGKGTRVRPPAAALEGIDGRLRIYFPSDETVAQSRGGRQVSRASQQAGEPSDWAGSRRVSALTDATVRGNYLRTVQMVGFRKVPATPSPRLPERADRPAAA